jgi:hypothetical protein
MSLTSNPRRTGKTLAAMAAFNEHVPIGSSVLYWPGAREGEPRRSATRSAAWMLGDHTPVVMVDGYPGGIALTHILPVADAGTSNDAEGG